MNMSILKAIEESDFVSIKEFIKEKGDINTAINASGETLLMRAVWFGKVDLVRVLINTGVNVNAITGYGNTSLMDAARQGFKDIVIILIKAKANINAQDKGGYRALDYAIYFGHKEIVGLLKKEGAKSGFSNKEIK